MSELFANNATTTLASSALAGDTTISVASATGFPGSGNFRLMVDTELMLVTAVSGTTFTVTRGAEGTTPAAHSSGATVKQEITAGALKQLWAEAVSSGTLASRPAAGIANRLYLHTDGPYLSLDNGSSWQTYGPVYPLTPPPEASFAWVNQNAATETTTQGITVLRIPGPNPNSGFQYQVGRVVPLPSPPYTVTMGFRVQNMQGNLNFGAGLFLYNSSSTKSVTFFIYPQWTNYAGPNILQIRQYTDPKDMTGFILNAQPSLCAWGPLIWLRIKDDNAGNRSYWFSTDGYNFINVYTEADTTWITPDRVGYFGDPYNNTAGGQDMVLSIYQWSLTSP